MLYLLYVFEDADEDFCEVTPMCEAVHELEQEIFLGETILPQGALSKATFELLKVVRQLPAEGESTSSRAWNQDVPTRRLFFVHALCISADGVFREIMANPYVRKLAEEELDTTQMGRTRGVDSLGHPLADNLSNYLPGYIS